MNWNENELWRLILISIDNDGGKLCSLLPARMAVGFLEMTNSGMIYIAAVASSHIHMEWIILEPVQCIQINIYTRYIPTRHEHNQNNSNGKSMNITHTSKWLKPEFELDWIERNTTEISVSIHTRFRKRHICIFAQISSEMILCMASKATNTTKNLFYILTFRGLDSINCSTSIPSLMFARKFGKRFT